MLTAEKRRDREALQTSTVARFTTPCSSAGLVHLSSGVLSVFSLQRQSCPSPQLEIPLSGQNYISAESRVSADNLTS